MCLLFVICHSLQGPLLKTQHSEIYGSRRYQARGAVQPNKTTQWKLSVRKKKKKVASDTHIPAETRMLCTWTARKHTHAHVHLHSEANPFSKVEVRCSQIRRGCSNNIHVIKNPEFFLYTETTTLRGSKGSFWHTVKGCFLSPQLKEFIRL